MQKAKKFYAVKNGKQDNVIVESWPECQALTSGVPGVKFKSFPTRPAAQEWLKATPGLHQDSYDGTAVVERPDIVYLYSDGACSYNPGPGGWGAIVGYNGQNVELTGYKEKTTNNAMELTGFISALKFAIQNHGKKKKYMAILDSNYVINGASQWVSSWAANGWKRPGGEPIANLELWQEIFELTKGLDIKYKWVKGHNGHPENERCDELAVTAYKCYQDKNDKSMSDETESYTNLQLLREVDKETLAQILTSVKFQNLVMTGGVLKLLDVLDQPARDWNVKGVKIFLKSKGVEPDFL